MKIIKITLLALCLLLANIGIAVSEINSDGILREGSWVLSPYPDPFNNKYPVVGYLPTGTIILESKPHDVMKKYNEVLTHFGHRVLVQKTVNIQGRSRQSVAPFKGVVMPPKEGNNKLILHKNILCLNEQDRIKVENERCRFKKEINAEQLEGSTPKIGKGWIYSFKPKEDSSDWFWLEAQLDDSTKNTIESYGLDVVSANFSISKAELNHYENLGYITLLNKEMPLMEFEYMPDTLFYLECGLENVNKKYIEGKLGGRVGVNRESQAAKIINSFIKVDVGAEGSVGVDNETIVTISTKNNSYLFYNVIMRERGNEEESVIKVRKDFNCVSGAVNQPGLDINEVKFTIQSNEPTDPDAYVFEKEDIAIKTPEENKKTIGRPVYVSVNSVSQHSKLLQYIIKRHKVNIQMAHFMLVNINNTCKAGSRNHIREKCLMLSK
ncbi:hypothetical protein [Candidatus Spongiihabitans sp.]|uniref:hypothetical protein n=1 Tax=Candidatus Spongiihabitans sp. TaxID=3101308 RepID=UPI003C6ED35B